MLPITDALPQAMLQPLLKHNIRFVEQFLSLLQTPRSARNLALAVDRPLEELETLAARIRSEHPDLLVPEPSGRAYNLGYGKPSSWQDEA